MAKSRTMFQNDSPSSAPGDGSPELIEFKEKNGLPSWPTLLEELQQIADARGASWADELKARIEVHRKYVEFQTVLAQNFTSLGLQYVNAVNNVVDLQNKLFMLEEKLREEGTNPLESEAWVKAREMLAKELQFIHKHKLDSQRFDFDVQRLKRRQGDDAVFVVEAEHDDR